MALDDVVHSSTRGPRVREAMERSIRWLDRCIVAHQKPSSQNLFGIIQGGLDSELRRECIAEMTKRPLPGFAIGGLSGGESKDDFWRIVDLCTSLLPENKPRYLMGVGYAVDLLVCSALGVDMFDCVYPTRTARFGTALVNCRGGVLHLRRSEFKTDEQPIDSACPCFTCKHYSRAYLHTVAGRQAVGALLITHHNVAYQMRLMGSIRKAMLEGRFPEFAKLFLRTYYGDVPAIPSWVIDAMAAAGVQF